MVSTYLFLRSKARLLVRIFVSFRSTLGLIGSGGRFILEYEGLLGYVWGVFCYDYSVIN